MKLNPFIVTGYRSPKYFCDRENETRRLISAIENNRHLTLFSLRRMGKTGLIRHAYYELEKEKQIIPVYTDIMPTANLADFTMALVRAVFSTMAKNKSLIKTILTSLSAIRPVLSYHPVTGMPEITVKIDNPSDSEHTLESVFAFLSRQKQNIVIAIDEFQQISTYPQKNVESILRSLIQPLNNVTFIFSGSRKHILSEIFSSPGRPFFNSTEIMEINTINAEDYYSFITGHFKEHGMTIDQEALDLIKEYTFMHTFYIQFLCNRLFALRLRNISKKDTAVLYSQVLNENEPVYASYINLITTFQFRLLKAVAAEKGATGLSSKEFLQRNNLGAASSVNTALNSLIEKEFIFKEKDKYYLTDRFFAGWITQTG